MKLNLKSGLLIIFAVVTIALGGLYLFRPTGVIKPTGVSCGGWDTFGVVVCECLGYLKEHTCPPGAYCSSLTDTCYGICGGCKCYEGSVSNGVEIPCDGRDQHFKRY